MTDITDWPELHGSCFEGDRVLVTGGAGFIGSHLCFALAQLGAQVVALDDLSGGERANLESAQTVGSDRIELVEGSLLDKTTLAACTDGCRFVFHQAALPSVSRSIEHPLLFHEVNVTGTINVLEAARRSRVERVMFAASSSAYGDAKTLPKTETMAPLPQSPYAATKLAGEHQVRAYAACFDLDAVSLRYFNIFGPRQNANSAYAGVIAAFAKALVTGQDPQIDGDGQQSRDFTYVANAVQANLLAARTQQPIGGEVINVGSGVRISINELATTMAEELGRTDLQPQFRPPRPGDVKHSLADVSKAKTVLGYCPIVSFREGVRWSLQWYSKAQPWT